MSDDHEKLKEDVAAYALDALDLSERNRVEAHLQDCLECPQLLREYQELLGLLPYGLQVTTPPPEVRATLLAQTQTGSRSAPELAQSGHAVKPGPDRPDSTSSAKPTAGFWKRLAGFGRPLRWATVGVALAGLLLWNIQLQLWNGQLQRRVAILERSVGFEHLASLPAESVIALKGSGAPTAVARLYVYTDRQRGELAITGLSPLPAGRTYRLWFARPNQPTMTGGAFQVDAFGGALVAVNIPVPLEEVSNIAVTEEPVTEAPEETLRPTGEHLLDRES
jgi:anti-sigma-K factor RskA